MEEQPAEKRENVQSSGMRKCPYCAELIKVEAIKCRYCRTDLPLPNNALLQSTGQDGLPTKLVSVSGQEIPPLNPYPVGRKSKAGWKLFWSLSGIVVVFWLLHTVWKGEDDFTGVDLTGLDITDPSVRAAAREIGKANKHLIVQAWSVVKADFGSQYHDMTNERVVRGNVCGSVEYDTPASRHTADFVYFSGMERAWYSKNYTQGAWEKVWEKMCVGR